MSCFSQPVCGSVNCIALDSQSLATKLYHTKSKGSTLAKKKAQPKQDNANPDPRLSKRIEAFKVDLKNAIDQAIDKAIKNEVDQLSKAIGEEFQKMGLMYREIDPEVLNNWFVSNAHELTQKDAADKAEAAAKAPKATKKKSASKKKSSQLR